MGKKYDFSGWATRANTLCSDGRIITKDAFKHCDGIKVPLVWNHQHNDPHEVLGHALLEHRDEGVYAYGTFNDTDSGQTAKLLVQNGDVDRLSIYANKLKQQGQNVLHGAIREVSLVLAGANPGAYIDAVMMHGDDPCSTDHIVDWGSIEEAESLFHAETEEEKKGDTKVADNKENKATAESEETVKEVFDTLSEKQKKAVYAIIVDLLEEQKGEAKETEDVKHSDDEPADDNEETVADVFETLSEKQKTAVYAIVAEALRDDEEDEMDDVKHSYYEEGDYNDMKRNVFDQTETKINDVLEHSEMTAIFADAQRCGSLREAVLAHGIENIDVLFPDAQAINKEPEFIKRNDDWVAKVLNGVHHSPFARVKTVFADITADEARAKGYTKGKLKIEEVFKLLKRVTNPTTVYKKQKLDRDDLLDITDFNVIPWMKGELRMMLDEELARAYLIGDGRTALSEDKINEENIRPIWTMEDLFTVKVGIEVADDATAEDKAKQFINACIKSRKEYKGSGNPSMFMPEDILTDCLLIEDKNGRVIYDTEDKLRARLRVREIIPVPVMENQTRTVEGKTHTLAGIYVNLQDYNVGTNKGGEISMFDDFDIDYNQYKYLMETRCSGTLTKPFSAVAIEFVSETAAG